MFLALCGAQKSAIPLWISSRFPASFFSSTQELRDEERAAVAAAAAATAAAAAVHAGRFCATAKTRRALGPLQIRPGDVSGDVSDDVSERENPDYFPLRDQNRAPG